MREQLAAIRDFIINREILNLDFVPVASLAVQPNSLSDFIAKRVHRIEVVNIGDDIQYKRLPIPARGKRTADLLFIDNGRDRRPEKDHAGNVIHMNAFVQHVDCQKDFQMLATVRLERSKCSACLRIV